MHGRQNGVWDMLSNLEAVEVNLKLDTQSLLRLRETQSKVKDGNPKHETRHSKGVCYNTVSSRGSGNLRLENRNLKPGFRILRRETSLGAPAYTLPRWECVHGIRPCWW